LRHGQPCLGFTDFHPANHSLQAGDRPLKGGLDQGQRKVAQHGGRHRQTQLGDGDFPGRRTIAKAFGLDDATRPALSMHPSSGLYDRPAVWI